MQTVTYTLPAHWNTALIYGDDSGLDDDEVSAVFQFGEWLNKQHGTANCVDCTDYPEFTRNHDATDWALACDCLEYTFIIG